MEIKLAHDVVNVNATEATLVVDVDKTATIVGSSYIITYVFVQSTS